MDHSIDPDPYEFGKMTRNVCCKRSQFSSKSLFLHNTHYTYARIISNISHVQPTCHASLFLTQIFIICSVSIFGCYRSIFQQQPKLGPIHSKEYSTTTHIDWIQTQEITVGRFRSASVRLSSLAGIRETNGQTVRELVCECTTPLWNDMQQWHTHTHTTLSIASLLQLPLGYILESCKCQCARHTNTVHLSDCSIFYVFSTTVIPFVCTMRRSSLLRYQAAAFCCPGKIIHLNQLSDVY